MKDNNEKTAIALRAIEGRTASIPNPDEKVDSGKDFVSFGTGNQYPDFLYDCYTNCSILQSIVNGLTDYVAGSGFVNEETNDKIINNHDETWGDLIAKWTSDYIIFGAFAVQAIRNGLGQINELYWIDVRRVRLDEDGEYVYYSKEWKKYGRDAKKYPRLQGPNIHGSSIFYFKNPKSRGIYGLPMWSSAVKDVTTAIEISNFHLSSILNNFAPSAIVNFNNGVPSEEQQNDIEKRLNEKFSGSDNASRLLVSFNDNKEQAVSIERLAEDSFDQKYAALAKSVRENIFVAFRAQPQLFGTDPDRTGFNSVEYSQSFKLFKKTVVEPIQREIEGAFKRMDPAFDFQLKEFEIQFEEQQTTPEV